MRKLAAAVLPRAGLPVPEPAPREERAGPSARRRRASWRCDRHRPGRTHALVVPGYTGPVLGSARRAVVLFLPACFHPVYERPACGPGGACPSGLQCSAQGVCESGSDAHPPDSGPGVCGDGVASGVEACDGADLRGKTCLDFGSSSSDGLTCTVDCSFNIGGCHGAQPCYGPSGWQVCLAAAPGGQISLPGAIDTDKSSLCLQAQPPSWTATQPAACIIVGDIVTVSSTSVTGARPLVLVAQTRITVTGLLDAASHRSSGAVGAGAGSPGDCRPFASSPGAGPPGGGGAGGSFAFPGGNGGTGDSVNQPGGQAASAIVGSPARLRGGCAGQPGGGGSANDGGVGGGAVYLVSAGTISVTGTIDVSGAGGKGRNAEHGGGGGGSGGMIVLHAASIATMQGTLLIADGGGGGGGSSAHDTSQQTANGDDGHEPILQTSIVPARGGAGGVGTMGFNGGSGGNGYPALSNTMPGLKGEAGDTGSGGGGGGGGGGYIRSNLALGMATVLPAADIKP